MCGLGHSRIPKKNQLRPERSEVERSAARIGHMTSEQSERSLIEIKKLAEAL